MRLTAPDPGIIVPLMPLLTEEKNYDFQSVEKQVEHYIKNDVAGIFVLTTCGQSASFSLQENKDLASAVIHTTGKRVPIYVGIGRARTEPEYAPKMIEHAMKQDADAVVALCLDYTPDEQITYFQDLNKRKFPILAYSLGTAEKKIEKLEEVLELESVVGMKLTRDIRNPEGKKYFQRALASGKPVFMGEDICLYDALESGASGGVNAIANLIPRELVTLYKFYQQGETEAAKTIQEKVNVLLETIYYGKDNQGNPVDAPAAVQYAIPQRLECGSDALRVQKKRYTRKEAQFIRDALQKFQASVKE